jgi:hypothetical protein
MKEESPKPEMKHADRQLIAGFWFRTSFGFRVSDFGFSSRIFLLPSDFGFRVSIFPGIYSRYV